MTLFRSAGRLVNLLGDLRGDLIPFGRDMLSQRGRFAFGESDPSTPSLLENDLLDNLARADRVLVSGCLLLLCSRFLHSKLGILFDNGVEVECPFFCDIY